MNNSTYLIGMLQNWINPATIEHSLNWPGLSILSPMRNFLVASASSYPATEFHTRGTVTGCAGAASANSVAATSAQSLNSAPDASRKSGGK